ncbi:MAG TPA: tetratricopeptide repeat protein [Bryobacteraceae bacterium]|nr:tetratricopeptide repeat protein [Bryobacteraceae bacterium]
MSLAILPFLLAQAGSGAFAENHRRGEEYIHRGDLPAAIPYLRRAYEIDPVNYENGFDYALACLETKAVEEARRVVNEMLARSERSELRNLLGDIEEASGNMLEAVRQYEKAARADPSEKNVFDLGTELQNHQGFEQAISIFEFGVGRYPNSARMRVGLGVAYYSAGRYPDAVESLCRAVDLDPKDMRALDFLGRRHDVSPELAGEVRKRLANFVKLYPDSAPATYYYALSLDDPREQERLLRSAARLDPNLAEAWLALAKLHDQQGRAAEAIREFEQVVRIAPATKSAHYRLAQLYQASGQPEKARQELRAFQSLP